MEEKGKIIMRLPVWHILVILWTDYGLSVLCPSWRKSRWSLFFMPLSMAIIKKIVSWPLFLVQWLEKNNATYHDSNTEIFFVIY